MLIHVELAETYGASFKEMLQDPEKLTVFKAHWPLATGDIDPERAYNIQTGPTRLTEEEAAVLMGIGCKLQIKPLPGAMISKMQDRAKWDYSMEPTAEHLRKGEAVQIAIPDLGLLQIREVTVEEDCCTHHLQGMLDDGWRILAVCPPNAARRPDYILGRTTKEK
jgi:hypothetical protein